MTKEGGQKTAAGSDLMLQTGLKDLTRWRWVFYLRLHGRDPSKNSEQNWKSFLPVLNEAVEWAGGEEKSKVAWPDDLPHGRQTDALLVSLPPLESDGTLRSFDARAMLDVLYLQAWVCREGAAAPEDVARLRQPAWRAEQGVPTLVGQAECLWAEVGQVGEEEARDVARRMLESWAAKPVRQVEVMELDFGFVALPAGLKDEVWVLLVRDTGEARRQANHLAHYLLPPLFLARLKGWEKAREFERELLPALHKLEDELSQELKRIKDQPRRLKTMEEASYRISRHQAELAEMLSRCEETRETLRVNAENLKRLLNDDPLFAAQKARLDAWLAAPLRLQLEQIETDLRYLAVTHTQAERTLHGIETMTGVRSARWERAIAILFGLFVVFGIADAFPEIQAIPMKWRIPAVFVLGVGIYLFTWLLSRRR